MSVVVPLFKSAGTVRELVERIRRALDSQGFLPWEIILVNDASPDGSLAAAETLAGGNIAVRVISFSHHVGQNAAVLAGVKNARGDWTVIMDADLQDPPEALPILLNAVRERYDAVFAGRVGDYEPRHRLFTSKIAKLFLSWTTGTPLDAGLFVAISRRMRHMMMHFEDDRPHVVAMIGLTRLPVTSVPISRSRRPRGGSAYTSWSRIRVGINAVRFVLRWRRPWGWSAGPDCGKER